MRRCPGARVLPKLPAVDLHHHLALVDNGNHQRASEMLMPARPEDTEGGEPAAQIRTGLTVLLRQPQPQRAIREPQPKRLDRLRVRNPPTGQITQCVRRFFEGACIEVDDLTEQLTT